MLQPSRTKFRKMQKGRNRGCARNNSINFGFYALQSLSRGRLTSYQIESARRVITRVLNREGKIWICVFPDKPITKKPLAVRMGKGKGVVEYWVALVQPGKILYEIDGVSESLARFALKSASFKLSVKTMFIVKNFN